MFLLLRLFYLANGVSIESIDEFNESIPFLPAEFSLKNVASDSSESSEMMSNLSFSTG